MRPPDAVEDRTSAWLTSEFDAGVSGVGADTLIYGEDGQPARLTKEHFEHLVRKLAILRWVDRLPCRSFLDVGAGCDHVPALVRERRGAEAYYADLVHRVNLPNDGERIGRLDHAVTLDLRRLPFRDGAFDVVLASEVLEHLVRPVEAIAELVRVARVAVVMTSLEALAPDRLRRALSHLAVDVRQPHVERNFFAIDEIQAIFGPGLHHQPLLSYAHSPVNPFWPRDRIDAAFAAIRDRAALEAAVARAATPAAHGPGTMGILLARTAPGIGVAPPPGPDADAALAGWLVHEVASLEYYAFATVCGAGALRRRPDIGPPGPARDRPVAPALFARLQCPDCRAPLAQAQAALRCTGCDASFATECGVPILYPKHPHDDPEEQASAVRRLCGDDAARAATVRRVMARLRRNEAPPGPLKRALWRLEHAAGSPLRRRGLWPAES
jgi:SAM-dependent methyltransferase